LKLPEAGGDNKNLQGNNSEESISTNNITDDDLIAAVRKSSILDVDTISDKKYLSTDNIKHKNESSDQISLESMAGTLISVTQKIAGTLDNAHHIPPDKKEELATLLKGVPGFITKIVDMNDKELETILQHKTLSEDGICTPEDHRKESEYLMKTLEALRKSNINNNKKSPYGESGSID
jgi:hypothetical protein